MFLPLKNLRLQKLQEKNNFNFQLIISFLIFLGFYIFNFETYNNLYSNDFYLRYKQNGIIIINQIINFDFININFFNSFFIPEFITGILLKIFSNDLLFSIASNFLNIILLFLSFYFFFKSLNIKNSYIFLVFLLIFFSYKANWIWCFRKLPDIYFLFIFSIIFFFTCKGIKQKKSFYFFISLIFCILSLFVRPQGYLNILFLIYGYSLFKFENKINLFRLSFIFFLIYVIFFPFLTFLIIKIDSLNIFKVIIQFMETGKINGLIHYNLEMFKTQFSLPKNNLSELLFYYYLFIKKLIYLFTFIRDHYSTNHNFFLFLYVLNIYFFLITNFKKLYKENKIFVELIFFITLLSVLFHASLIIGSEPNRYQLFHLTPLYILVSLSINEILIKKLKSFRYN